MLSLGWQPSKYNNLTQCWFNVGPVSETVQPHENWWLETLDSCISDKRCGPVHADTWLSQGPPKTYSTFRSIPPGSKPADTSHWINVGVALVHHLRRWANVKPILIQPLVSAGKYHDPVLLYCWASVADAEPALSQHWVKVSYLLGSTWIKNID